MENTRYGAIQELLEKLKKTGEAIESPRVMNYCLDVVEKVRDLGDVRVHLMILDQMLPLLRLLRTDRALPTIALVRPTQPLLNRMTELIEKLGNLGRLRDQLAVVEDLEKDIYQRGDLNGSYGKLKNDDIMPKLDALKQLTACLQQFQAEVLQPKP